MTCFANFGSKTFPVKSERWVKLKLTLKLKKKLSAAKKLEFEDADTGHGNSFGQTVQLSNVSPRSSLAVSPRSNLVASPRSSGRAVSPRSPAVRNGNSDGSLAEKITRMEKQMSHLNTRVHYLEAEVEALKKKSEFDLLDGEPL